MTPCARDGENASKPGDGLHVTPTCGGDGLGGGGAGLEGSGGLGLLGGGGGDGLGGGGGES